LLCAGESKALALDVAGESKALVLDVAGESKALALDVGPSIAEHASIRQHALASQLRPPCIRAHRRSSAFIVGSLLEGSILR
jgi:hypothetical protein